jgi:drug/metabolite transporter (DMT)-like permease
MAMAMIWFMPLLWTVNLVVARQAPGVVTPHVLALGRWAIAGLVLVLWTHRELWRMRREVLKAWPQSVVLGACGMWICGAWVYIGAESTGAMNISLIYSSAPVLIAIGSALWLGERITLWQALGVAMSLSGVVHVVVRGEWTHLGELRFVVGDLWVVCSAVAWAAFSLLQKKWPSPLGSSARLATMCVGGVVVILPFAIYELCAADAPVLGQQALLQMMATALIPGVAAYWIYGWTLKVLGASRVAVILYAGPLYAAVVAWGVLGEPLGWYHLAGGVLILSGVGLVMATRRTNEAVTPEQL